MPAVVATVLEARDAEVLVVERGRRSIGIAVGRLVVIAHADAVRNSVEPLGRIRVLEDRERRVGAHPLDRVAAVLSVLHAIAEMDHVRNVVRHAMRHDPVGLRAEHGVEPAVELARVVLRVGEPDEREVGTDRGHGAPVPDHPEIAAVGIDGIDRTVGFAVAGVGDSCLDAAAEGLERRGDGDVGAAENSRERIECIEAPAEQINISPGLVGQEPMLAQPGHVVDADHAAVGDGADAKIKAPVAGHGDIGDRVIALGRQVGHDGCVRAVVAEGGDHSPPLLVAMGHINAPIGHSHAADRPVHPEFVAAQAKRELPPARIDLDE